MSIELITEYHPNGQKKYKGHYNGVHPVGDHTAWYECGDKEYESIELDESTEIVTYWYENGQIKSKGNCTDYWKSGSWTEWNENGNKKQTGIHGPNKTIQWTDWYINGQKESFNSFNGVGQPTFSKYWDLRGNPTKLPKEFRIHATDKDDTVATVSKKNKGGNMEAFYVSIYVPLAIALFILLPLLGVGMCWLYRKVKKGKPQGS